MYQLRNILVRMRQGESDRSLSRLDIVGRDKARQSRRIATSRGWLDEAQPMPDDQTLSQAFSTAVMAVSVSNTATCQPRRHTAPTGSTVEPYRQFVIEWIAQGVESKTIHQALVRNHHYTGSYSSVHRFVSRLSPAKVKPTAHLEFKPGEAAQIDFSTGPVLIDSRTDKPVKTWFFLITLAFSRHPYAELVLNQKVDTWLLCHRHAFEFFHGIPQRLIIDNARCAITKACYHDPVVQRAYAQYAEGYGFRIEALPPRAPQMKGRVESGIHYLKRNFVPTRLFVDLHDANRQLLDWIQTEAGQRCHGATHDKPLNLFAIEAPVLQPLPTIPPEIALWARVKVHRDAHVQFAKCLYSVPYALMGQTLWLKATPHTIRLYQEQTLLVTHARTFTPGSRRTLDAHLPPNALAYQMRSPTWCQQQAERIGEACNTLVTQLFADRVLYNLRAVQGILGLEKPYGTTRLEAACQRALDFHNPRYGTVKSILQKGLDQQMSTQQVIR